MAPLGLAMTWRAFIQLLVTLLGLAGVKARHLPPVNGVSRRAFLKALGVSAVALANLPAGFALDEPLDLDDWIDYTPGDLADWDALFKRIYLPAIVEQLNAPNHLMQFMGIDEGDPRGSFVVPVKVGKNYYTAVEPGRFPFTGVK